MATELITMTNETLTFKSAYLTQSTVAIRKYSDGMRVAVERGAREIACVLADVSTHVDELKKDGFKNVTEYAERLGIKASAAKALSVAGQMYKSPEVPEALKALPPSKIRELKPVVKRGEAGGKQLAADAEKLASMTQAELRAYARGETQVTGTDAESSEPEVLDEDRYKVICLTTDGYIGNGTLSGTAYRNELGSLMFMSWDKSEPIPAFTVGDTYYTAKELLDYVNKGGLGDDVHAYKLPFRLSLPFMPNLIRHGLQESFAIVAATGTCIFVGLLKGDYTEPLAEPEFIAQARAANQEKAGETKPADVEVEIPKPEAGEPEMVAEVVSVKVLSEQAEAAPVEEVEQLEIEPDGDIEWVQTKQQLDEIADTIAVAHDHDFSMKPEFTGTETVTVDRKTTKKGDSK